MRNGNISEQLKMQEKQIADEKRKMNTDVQIGTDTEKIGNKLTNFQNAKSENDLSNLIEDKQENKQSFNLPDLGLSSALGIFTLEPGPDRNNLLFPRRKRRNPSGDSGSREVGSEFISRTHVGYFRSWLPCRLEGGSPQNNRRCENKFYRCGDME